MSALTDPAEPSRFSVLHQRISIATWLVVLLLSLRGLFAFYGMKDKGSFEQIINFITEPIVQLFNFKFLASSDIPAFSVSFAVVSILIVSSMVQIGIKYTEMRLARTRTYVLQRSAISAK